MPQDLFQLCSAGYLFHQKICLIYFMACKSIPVENDPEYETAESKSYLLNRG